MWVWGLGSQRRRMPVCIDKSLCVHLRLCLCVHECVCACHGVCVCMRMRVCTCTHAHTCMCLHQKGMNASDAQGVQRVR